MLALITAAVIYHQLNHSPCNLWLYYKYKFTNTKTTHILTLSQGYKCRNCCSTHLGVGKDLLPVIVPYCSYWYATLLAEQFSNGKLEQGAISKPFGDQCSWSKACIIIVITLRPYCSHSHGVQPHKWHTANPLWCAAHCCCHLLSKQCFFLAGWPTSVPCHSSRQGTAAAGSSSSVSWVISRVTNFFLGYHLH
jgi:hypothetical protein